MEMADRDAVRQTANEHLHMSPQGPSTRRALATKNRVGGATITVVVTGAAAGIWLLFADTKSLIVTTVARKATSLEPAPSSTSQRPCSNSEHEPIDEEDAKEDDVELHTMFPV